MGERFGFWEELVPLISEEGEVFLGGEESGSPEGGDGFGVEEMDFSIDCAEGQPAGEGMIVDGGGFSGGDVEVFSAFLGNFLGDSFFIELV